MECFVDSVLLLAGECHAHGPPFTKERGGERERESEIGKVKLCNMDIHDGCGLSS